MKTITTHERLQLIGLVALAATHNRAIKALEVAACIITGEKPNEGGHTGDAIYTHDADVIPVVDDLLRKLSITVEDRAIVGAATTRRYDED